MHGLDVSRFYIHVPMILTLPSVSGNFLIMAGTCLITVSLTRGGVNAAWQAASILALLITGIIVLIVFFAYETLLAKHPLVSEI